MRFLTSLALATIGLTASVPSVAGTLLVPQQFPTITRALAASRSGDTVLVSPKAGGAPYREALTITTPGIVLRGRNSPVIDGTGLGTLVPAPPPFQPYTIYPSGVDVQASRVTVRDLTIQGFGYGATPNDSAASAINVGQSAAGAGYSDILIRGNTLRGCEYGLTITGYSGDVFGFTFLKGYQVLGNTVTDNSATGAAIAGASVLVAGNRFIGNGGDGLDLTGVGVTVSGNESGGNAYSGLSVHGAGVYDPAVSDPASPNPAPTVTALNFIHDNGGYGIEAQGTQVLSGNAVTGNTGYGIYLANADYATVAGNVVSGTALAAYTSDPGTGILVDYSATGAGLTLSANRISGNSGDGIFLNSISGSLISGNNVTGNREIGIHLSDYTAYGYPPNTVAGDRASRNGLLDARDDAAAPDSVTYNGDVYYGDDTATGNVWTNDSFGTTDPVGLGR